MTHDPGQTIVIGAPQTPEEMVAVLEDLITGLQSGRIQSGTLHLQHGDGTADVFALSYRTEKEQDAAIVRLLCILGEMA